MNDLLGLLTADNRLGEGIIMNLQERILEAEVALDDLQ